MCTLPLLAGENVRRAFVVPTVAASSTSSCTSPWSATAGAPVREIVAVPGRVEGDVVEIADLFVTGGAASWSGPTGSRRTSTGSSGRGYDLSALLAPGCGMTGLLVGLLPRAGALPRLVGFWVPPDEPVARPRGRAARPAADEIVQAGFAGLLGAHACWLRSVDRRSLLVLALVQATVGVAADRRVLRGRWRRYVPVAVVRAAGSAPPGRVCATCGRMPSTTSPPRVRAGLSLPEALRSSGPAARRSCATPFRAFADDYRLTGRFDDSLDRLKDRLTDPVGDRIVESLRIAREVGGTDLGRLLRTLSGVPARGRPHPRRARDPAVAGPSTPPGWRSPRRGSCSPCSSTNPESVRGLRHRAGVVVLAVGGGVCRGRLPGHGAHRPAARGRAGAAMSGLARTRCAPRLRPGAGAVPGVGRACRATVGRAWPTGCCPTCATRPGPRALLDDGPARAAAPSGGRRDPGRPRPRPRARRTRPRRRRLGAPSPAARRAGRRRRPVPRRAGAVGRRSVPSSARLLGAARPRVARRRSWSPSCCSRLRRRCGLGVTGARPPPVPPGARARGADARASSPRSPSCSPWPSAPARVRSVRSTGSAGSSQGELAGELRRCLADARAGANLPDRAPGAGRPHGAAAACAASSTASSSPSNAGTPLAEVLRAQAQDVREDGRRALMEAGGRKEIAMMVPVVFLILPVTVALRRLPRLHLLPVHPLTRKDRPMSINHTLSARLLATAHRPAQQGSAPGRARRRARAGC